MIRRFFFATTLLVPSLVNAADPSANFSVQVVPPGSAGAPGSGVPAPPGAAAAGFTTVALNSDFTQQLPANWLGGCAVAGNGAGFNQNDTTGHIWYLNLWWFIPYDNCVVVQKPDPTDGRLVLDIPWVVDTTNYNYGRGMAIETASWNWNPGTTQGSGVDFPINAYYEAIIRMTPVEPSSFGAVVTWPSAAIVNGATQPGLEGDVVELDAGSLGNSDSAVHNWDNPNAANSAAWVWLGTPPDFDANQYHKFGFRTTSDGSNPPAACGYIDDVFRGCVTISSWVPSANNPHRYFINLQSFCDSWNHSPPCNNRDGETQHMYVKSVRVWSCDTWRTTQCLRPVLTGAP